MLTLTKTFPDTLDDYEVRSEGKPIGRIYKTPGAPPAGQEWFWVYYRGRDTSPQDQADKGMAGSLEEAKKKFRIRFEL